MDQDDSEFLARLLETFRIEAEEHFEVLSNGLLELERDPEGDHLPLVETLFREAHSLKGAARAVELGDIESVCQAIESVFAAWKRGEIGASTSLFDTLNEAVDALARVERPRARQRQRRRGDGRADRPPDGAGRVARGGGPAQPGPPPQTAKADTTPASGGAAPSAAPKSAATAGTGRRHEAHTAVRARAGAAQGCAGGARPRRREGDGAGRQAPMAEVSHQTDTIRVSLGRLTDLMLRMEELITGQAGPAPAHRRAERPADRVRRLEEAVAGGAHRDQRGTPAPLRRRLAG